MTKPSFFASVDWQLVAYAAFVGAVMSLLQTWRDRNAQKAKNLPLSPWSTLLPDTLIAALTGTFGSMLIAAKWQALNTFEGIGGLSAFFGTIAPMIWAWAKANGWETLIDALAGATSGGLQKLAEAAAKRGKGGQPDDPQPPAP